MTDLTATERDVLLIIQELTATYGYGPSVREIAHEMCFAAHSNVPAILDELQAKGYITRLRARVRSIRVLRPIPMPEEPEIVSPFARPVPAVRLRVMGIVT